MGGHRADFCCFVGVGVDVCFLFFLFGDILSFGLLSLFVVNADQSTGPRPPEVNITGLRCWPRSSIKNSLATSPVLLLLRV